MKFLLPFLLAGIALAADVAPVLSAPEKEQIYKLQISAHRALEHIQASQIQQRQAKIEELASQKELDRLNGDLERLNQELSKKYDADGKFNLTPDLAFESKETKK